MATAVAQPHAQPPPTSPPTHRHASATKQEPPKIPKSIGLYKLGRTLGEGTYGKVKLGTHMYTGQEVAVKIMRPHETNNRAEVEREISVLKLLKHPNIVQLFEVIEDENGRIFLVLELVAGGELFDYIVARGRVKEKEARKFFRQIISGVEYCHANLVVHRDLKPENLLLDVDGNVKINDFGFSNLISPGKLFNTFCGSPIYAPPEIILEKEYVGPTVDIWSMGVILYALVNGQLPWRLGKNGRIIDIDKLLAGQFENSASANLTKGVKDLMNRMIVADPKNRATLDEVRNHPWISEGCDGPPPTLLSARPPVKAINEEILNQVVLMGFDRETARSAILANEIIPVVTVYHLLLEKNSKNLPPTADTSSIVPSPLSPSIIPASAAGAIAPASPKTTPTSPPTSARGDVVIDSKDPRRRSLELGRDGKAPIFAAAGFGTNLAPISEDGGSARASESRARFNPSNGVSAGNLFLNSANNAGDGSPSIIHRRGRAHTISDVSIPPAIAAIAANASANAASTSGSPTTARDSAPTTARDQLTNSGEAPYVPKRRNSILSIFKKPEKGVISPSTSTATTTTLVSPAPSAAGSPAAAGSTSPTPAQAPAAANGPPTASPVPKRRLSLQELPMPWKSNKPAAPKEKLRSIKGVFNVDTTTMKPADQIVLEVLKVLTESGITFKQKGFVFKCKQKQPLDKAERVHFDLEICQIHGLNMNGVRFKRISGGVWAYRSLCQSLMQKMKL
eukprot:Phypoly_transcript_03645.p1 GENE.Phypoly_transcript_03645~~Phypoly_transcript_03645.p1  ORF type:complete len:738 (+),score=143.90 Phypoly_transcript_03645:152-2365(+)